MIRFVGVIFALAVATSAQAMSPAPLHQPNGMITQVREACGAGRIRVNGVCVARTTNRQSAGRCAGVRDGILQAFAFDTTKRTKQGRTERRLSTLTRTRPKV